MRLPWHNRTGLAQAAAFLATILTISLGLCGANVLALEIVSYESQLAGVLFVTGIAELIAILVSFAALIIVLFIMLFQSIEARLSSGHDGKGKL